MITTVPLDADERTRLRNVAESNTTDALRSVATMYLRLLNQVDDLEQARDQAREGLRDANERIQRWHAGLLAYP